MFFRRRAELKKSVAGWANKEPQSRVIGDLFGRFMPELKKVGSSDL